MPLHLLGKKSWNVYNADNVDRVRRDEAAARAREEAEEQRMQEEDEATRIAILRGERPPPLASPPDEIGEASPREHDGGTERPRKRRRIRGEDDTDREMRFAREDADSGRKAQEILLSNEKNRDAPLLDHDGHLQLFASAENTSRGPKKSRAKPSDRDQDRRRGVLLTDAAGYRNRMRDPWYVDTGGKEEGGADVPPVAHAPLSAVEPRDVWGNEDPRRREREQNRVSKSDPFALMQSAQRQLKQSERDKRQWHSARLEDVSVRESIVHPADGRQRRREIKRRKQGEEDDGSLDGFALDEPRKEKDGGMKESLRADERKHRRRHRHRTKSRPREESRRSSNGEQ